LSNCHRIAANPFAGLQRSTTSAVAPFNTIKNTDRWSTDPADDQTIVGQSFTTFVPAMNEWGMIVFMIFAGMSSAYYLKKRKTLQA
jgi:hypothetical protein